MPTMKFRFEVEVEIEHVEGKFESREDLGAQMKEALEASNPESLNGNSAEYRIQSWEVAVAD